MIIRLNVENFLSFNERIEMLLTPGKTQALSHHIIKGKKSRDIAVLKSSILYGANASGKSNLIKAVDFARNLVLSGSKNPDSLVYSKFKLDKQALEKNSRIEIEFRIHDKSYAYGFEFNHLEIKEEWLYLINKESETEVFVRRTDGDDVEISFHKLKVSAENKKRLEFMGLDTLPNELFLHACNKRNISNIKGIDDLTNAYEWFGSVLTIIYPDSRFLGMEVNIDSDTDLREVYQWFLSEFDTGISGVETKKVDFSSKEVVLPEEVKDNVVESLGVGERTVISSEDGIRYSIMKNQSGEIEAVRLMTKHKMKPDSRTSLFELGDDISFEISEESDGTQRLLDLIPAITELSKKNKVYLVDEIERSLHPNLVFKIFELFFNESKGVESQLICTTHESNLLNLDLFRKDEVWFVKKNADGESTVYSLEEFKPRKDKDIRTGYLKGRFDAVPVLTTMDNAPWKI